MPVVVTSGRGDAARARPLGPQFLPKPFTADDLVTAIVSCLPPADTTE
jgi:hypothetical protein